MEGRGVKRVEGEGGGGVEGVKGFGWRGGWVRRGGGSG